jgi:tRNA(fMet)-specific endonuclease VapC
MMYMIDTDISIYLINSKPPRVLEHFRQHSPGDIVMSAITLSELKYGVKKSSKKRQNIAALNDFAHLIHVCEFDSLAADKYADIRVYLESEGQLIGSMDMLIAAHALSLDLTLITNNVREFSRVPNLRIENWAE